MRPNTSMDPIARARSGRLAMMLPEPRMPSTIQHPDARSEIQMSSMAAHELGPMLTASEVAELLHLHVNTVKRLGDRGELPFYRVCKRGDRRFRLDDVLTFLATNR
jgi:excisionase family DNA binding protein